jgi:hypothetical protein
MKKSKTTAVLLAVFLGLWTWLYTYKEDNVKFWLSIVLCIFTSGAWGFVAWVWAIIESAIRSDSWYNSYYKRNK